MYKTIVLFCILVLATNSFSFATELGELLPFESNDELSDDDETGENQLADDNKSSDELADANESNDELADANESNDELSFLITYNLLPTQVQEESQDVRIITSDEINKLQSQSVVDVLEKIGNVNIKQYGSYGSTMTIYLRNFSGSAVAILVDGVQVNSAQSGEFDLNRLPLDSIEQIEIVNGASDTSYSTSGAVGGIINIITKRTESANSSTDTSSRLLFTTSFSNMSYGIQNSRTTGISTDIQNSRATGTSSNIQNLCESDAFSNIQELFDTQKLAASLSFRSSKFDLYFGTSFVNAQNKFSYYNWNNRLVIRENAEAMSGSTTTNLRLHFENDMFFDISNSFYLGRVYCPGNMMSGTVGLQKDLFLSTSVLWNVPYLLDGLTDMTSQVSYKYDRIFYDENISTSSSQDSLHNLHSLAASSSWIFYFADLVKLNVQGDISWNILDSTDVKISSSDNPQRLDIGLATSGKFSFGKHFICYPSIKLLLSENGNIVPIPKLGFSVPFSLGSNISFTINSNMYRMFVFPTLNQLYWTDSNMASGNKDLENEDGFGGDIIFSVKPFSQSETKINWNSSITVFSCYYKNKIQWTTGSNGKLTSTNVGKAAYFGGSISFLFEPTTWFSFSGIYDLSYTFLLTGDLTLKDNRRIMYTPVNKFSGNISFTFGNFVSVISASYTGERYISNANIRKLPEYFLLDISGSYKFKSGITCYTSVNNVTNTRYCEVDDYPMPGISVTMGVSFSGSKK